MKNHRIFHVINEMSEALSLSNDPKQLLEAALDTITEVLGVDCCWIQLGYLENRRLPLIARRGFTPSMEKEISLGSLEHDLVKKVAGLGYKIIIPDLSRDEEYKLDSFSEAGLRSLAAVPIRTYSIHGIMGIASKSGLNLNAEFVELLMAVAGVAGMALNKAVQAQNGTLAERELSPVELKYEATEVAGTRFDVESGEQEKQSNPVNAARAGKFESSVYELTRFTSIPLPRPEIVNNPVMKQTTASAVALNEFSKLWGNLPRSEPAAVKQTSIESTSAKTSRQESLKTEPETVEPVPPEPGPLPVRTREKRDPFTEHCRRIKLFRTGHAPVY